MHKIPVLATVSRTYGFLLGEIGTIFRLAWAPLLAAAAMSYVYGPQVMEAAVRAQSNPTAALETFPLQLLMGAVGFVAGIMATVALLRVVIFGDRKPGLFVYLWFGAAEFRLVLAYILLFIAIIAGAIAVALVFGLLGVLAAALPAAGLIVGLLAVALAIGLIWAMLRLTLIAPVVVAENNLGVERSWTLMGGNALRMLAVLLLTYLPFAILSGFIFLVVVGGELNLPDFKALADAQKAGPEAFKQAMEAWQTGFQASFNNAVLKHWPEMTALGFFSNLISVGLSAGVAGSAYNAIMDRAAEDTFK